MKKIFFSFLIVGMLIWGGCQSGEEKNTGEVFLPTDSLPLVQKSDSVVENLQKEASAIPASSDKQEPLNRESPENLKPPIVPQPVKNLEETMIQMGLVDIQAVEPAIKIELKYSTTDNFMGKDAYGDLNTCYLQQEVAEMLKKAYLALQEKHKGYTFVVYDGARPFAVQKKMWEIVKGTDKAHYVAKPDAKGSMHNYGCAVDLSVLNEKGVPLDMGTAFDHLGTEARTDIETDLLKNGNISKEQLSNRLILRVAMESAGFKVLKREWWHFNAFPDREVLAKYKKIP